MNSFQLGTPDIIGIVALALVVVGGFVIYKLQKRRTKNLRTQFGGKEYDRAVTESGNRRHGEDTLDRRSDRVQSFNVRSLTSADRARFIASWARIQVHFVDGPASAVSEADQLLRDVMTLRGYPVNDFDQRAEDISVNHPLVTEHYRAAHGIALRQISGLNNTEDLRQGMIHYRALFEDMVGEPKEIKLKVAS